MGGTRETVPCAAPGACCESSKFYETLVKDAERYATNATTKRKPRKKKSIPATKRVAHLKFKAGCAEHHLASIAPEKFIGVQELWCFNTKTKVLTVYRSDKHSGLDVRGQTIKDFDPKGSVSKKIGRKTEYYLERTLKGGKIVLRKLMNEINVKATTPTGRINSDTILLRVQ